MGTKALLKAPHEFVAAKAAQGSAAAMNVLGINYSSGRGSEIAVDHVKAAQCFAAAAKHGRNDGILNLAHCYRDGLGVEQNRPRAIELFAQAARQGDPYGKIGLADMYIHGSRKWSEMAKAADYLLEAAENRNGFVRGEAQYSLENLAGAYRKMARRKIPYIFMEEDIPPEKLQRRVTRVMAFIEKHPELTVRF